VGFEHERGREDYGFPGKGGRKQSDRRKTVGFRVVRIAKRPHPP